MWSFGKTSGTSFARQIFDEENSNPDFGESRPKKVAFCLKIAHIYKDIYAFLKILTELQVSFHDLVPEPLKAVSPEPAIINEEVQK